MPSSTTKFLDEHVAERMSRTASGAIAANLLVAIDGTDHTLAAQVAAANAVCHGVAEDDSASGKEFSIKRRGRLTLIAGGTVALNDEIVSDAAGKGVARGNLLSTLYNVVGRALTAAASGEAFTVEFNPYTVRGALEDVNNKLTTDSPVALIAADHGKTFTNLGASGAVTFSLPAAPAAGLRFRFVASTAQEIRVDPGANDALIIDGAKQADGKYASFDDEGELLEVISNANGDWIVAAEKGTVTIES